MKTRIKNTKVSFKNTKLSFKNHAFKGQNDFGDKKLKYRVQVICNRCKSRGNCPAWYVKTENIPCTGVGINKEYCKRLEK